MALAIIEVNEILKNADLPTYSELLTTLSRLVKSCDGDTLGSTKAPKWNILCESVVMTYAVKYGKSDYNTIKVNK